ncbi:hypothetical protein CYY_005934 [Polysphondylium violaceum]|uniref:Saposin B-type domain-containing protein n=1 Tax=Polysphondylium violaceum TaxID=133409 RepID=A0A8J4Q1R0_9MYCE|nr:hypothetical protein CYY_005934 [Polysphondylium violaceum]
MKILSIVAILCALVCIFNSVNAFTPIECDLCQLSVDSLESLTKADNLTYSEIYSALGRICTSIPSNYSTICKEFLDLSAPVIINQILNETSSLTICGEIQICSSSTLAKQQKTNQHTLCHYKRISKLIQNNLDCDDSNIACIEFNNYIDHAKNVVLSHKNIKVSC